jgi:hypothetical protein
LGNELNEHADCLTGRRKKMKRMVSLKNQLRSGLSLKAWKTKGELRCGLVERKNLLKLD